MRLLAGIVRRNVTTVRRERIVAAALRKAEMGTAGFEPVLSSALPASSRLTALYFGETSSSETNPPNNENFRARRVL